ncbi:PHD finger protein 7 [Drosophila tropicalis]|uniref:PHD finger protein 7 n=1 Tax=Drosophila tropicalis TaxID=46794 RepID=UPI0035AB83AB
MVKCVLCRSSKEDLVNFGPFHRLDNGKLYVHQNCLYLSSGLVQRGDDNHGVLHFLTPDIVKEAERTKPLLCCFCHEQGANIGCCKANCRRTFHTGCGIENKVHNQFCETFKSFCNYHVRRHEYRPKPTEECVICYEPLIGDGMKFNYVTFIYSPCCQNGWYHKTCLQRYANSSGYFFKCPLCNNSETFRDVSYWGISVPNSDASWELEPGAFHEQAQRDLICHAARCRNSNGRKANNEQELCYCNSCGSNPVHVGCTSHGIYECNDCRMVSDPIDDLVSQTSRNTYSRAPNNNNISMNLSRVHQKLRAPSSELSSVEFDTEDDADDDDDKIFNSLAAIGKENELKKKTTVEPERLATPTSSRPRNLQTLMPNNNANTNVQAARSRRRQTMHSVTPSVRSSARLSANKSEEIKGILKDSDLVARRTRSRSSVTSASPTPSFNAPREKSTILYKTEPRSARRRANVPIASQSNPLGDPSKPSTTLDISCVANRTRHRLPVYLANHK